MSTITDPERLPELPAGEEQRLQRAAFHLQQKLILRQWLKDNRLEHHYTKYANYIYAQLNFGVNSQGLFPNENMFFLH